MSNVEQAADFLWMLKEEHRNIVLDCAEPKTYAKGDWLIKTDEPANHFYLIQSGHVALDVDLPNQDPKRILTLSKGDILGWSWMVPPYKWQFSAQAQEEVTALKINALCIRGKCDENHEFGYNLMSTLMRMMAERITATRMQLLDIYGQATE